MKKKFIRVRSIKDIAIFASFIIAGCVLAFVPGADSVNLGGYTLIAVGVFLVFLLKNAYKDVENKEIYFKKVLSFHKDMKNPILSALASTPETIELSENGKGEAIRLEIYYGKTSGKAYLQLFEYVPHEYKLCSDMYEYDIEKVGKLLV